MVAVCHLPSWQVECHVKSIQEIQIKEVLNEMNFFRDSENILGASTVHF